MRRFITTVCAFVGITSSLLLLPAYTKPVEDLMKPVNAMLTRIMGIKMSDNFDRDFANVMIEHHQGGVDLSKVVYKYDRTQKLAKIAKVRFATLEKEQMELREILAKLPETYDQKAADKGGSRSELIAPINTMVDQMKNVKLTEDIEGNYADMMLHYSQAEIDLAKAELQHGENEDLKKLAQRMIDEEQKNITELKDWQNTRNSVSKSN